MYVRQLIRDMANAFHYSIGRKLIQAVSGAFLIVFLLLHSTINFFSVIDTFTGSFGAADGLFQKGCEFMALPIVTVMVPILALGFIIHIAYGIYISALNIKARGGLCRYESKSVAAADSWAAKNMLVLGIIVLGILAFHLTHFWAEMQLAMFTGAEEGNPYELLTLTFGFWSSTSSGSSLCGSTCATASGACSRQSAGTTRHGSRD